RQLGSLRNGLKNLYNSAASSLFTQCNAHLQETVSRRRTEEYEAEDTVSVLKTSSLSSGVVSATKFEHFFK
ncbi:2412_t:CDS:2, partial [Scutellospora calospora]